MKFWQVIESSCERPLSIESASSRLEASLLTMSAADVEAFCHKFDRLMDDAYQWDLWGVAYLINGGCGDDAFMDFRSSLIALGEDTFQAAIGDAESLLDLSSDELQELFQEGMLYCGPGAFESLTGKALDRSTAAKTEPAGQPWQETREALSDRFPRAWSVYGWEEPPTDKPVRSSRRPWWKFW